MICVDSRPFLSPGDDESVLQRGVHGEDRPTVRLGHHPNQEVVPPHVHVSVYCSGERQVVLHEKNKDFLETST